MSEQPTGLDLKKFVKDVILEVIRGVNEAADNVREAHSAEALRGAVNPRSDAATRDIEFDASLLLMNGGYRDLVRGRGPAHRRHGRGSRTRRRREDGGREASFRPLEQAGLFAEPGGGAGGIARRYLDTAQAAVYLGIGARTLARMRAAGEGLRHARIGRRVIYDFVDLDAWIEELKSPAAGRARRA